MTKRPNNEGLFTFKYPVPKTHCPYLTSSKTGPIEVLLIETSEGKGSQRRYLKPF